MHDVNADFSSDLHDMRRTARLVQLGNAVARDPTRPFPQVLNEAELAAMYRLMNSDAVDEADIAAAHRDETPRRSRALQTVLVLHDTTQMSFQIQGDIPMRTHLERVGPRTQGFRVHASLAVSAEPTHEPLGVVCWQPFVGSKRIQQEDEAFWNERGGLFANEGFRWQQGVALANARLEGVEAVHIADREADRYDLLEWMIREGVRFVFRQCHDRKLADESVFRDRLDEAKEITCLTSVRLSRRLGFKHNGRQRANLPREQGDVDLRVTATRLEIKRGLDPPRSSDRAAWREVAASAFLNVVQVQEVDPAEDDDALDWVLVTTEPIETAEYVLRIVDFYRVRWQIEEFFETIKTGCSFEKRQSVSAGALLNVLALTLPIAWQLHRLT
ncbi:MAG: hypothetical protein ACI81R_003036 [Bradymonadia bacterium]|jgi:hypothetical protein